MPDPFILIVRACIPYLSSDLSRDWVIWTEGGPVPSLDSCHAMSEAVTLAKDAHFAERWNSDFFDQRKPIDDHRRRFNAASAMLACLAPDRIAALHWASSYALQISETVTRSLTRAGLEIPESLLPVYSTPDE